MSPQEQYEAPLPELENISRERLPERELWAGIDARIATLTPRRRAPRLWPYGLAAGLSAALLTGVLLRAPQPGPTLEAVAAPVVTESAGRNTVPYSNQGGNTGGSAGVSNYGKRTLRSESRDNAPAMVAERAEAAGLLKTTYSSSSNGAHAQRAILRANLKLVLQAEREVRRALQRDPESENLQSLLTSAQEKRELLTTMLVHDGE